MERRVLITILLVGLVVLSGCSGPSNNKTPTKNPTDTSVEGDWNVGDSTETPSNTQNETPTITPTSTPESTENDQQDYNLLDNDTPTTSTPKPESAYDSAKASVYISVNFNNNIVVLLSELKAADHIYVTDSNGNRLITSLSGDVSYTQGSLSKGQFLLSGSSGGVGTKVTVHTSEGETGTLTIVGVLDGEKTVLRTYAYDTSE